MAEPLRGAGRIRLRDRNRNEVPRGVLFLYNETRRRDVGRRLWFGVAGSRGTGKSTLATRFNVLHRDVLRSDEVVVRNSYRFTINLNTRPEVNHTGLVHVGIYIDPIPIQPGGIEALYQIASLRAVIFLFDVNRNRTLNAARAMFGVYRRDEDENMLPSLLVGNKIDIRDRPRNTVDLPRRAVSTLYGASIARSIGALEYYECSALRNIGVGPVLDKILQLILR
ncbi:hypothetical protein AVEN_55278-1 [Araneus ventricosus]|uniref:Uncharacterized protein n=1 Tax=Araneus ventricosus TaxID=182803 RepID=A0A4Y2D8X4_ARAVE|nr:hypothetical protein AVEN_55278-1 [Araneus ventricosus]